MKKLSDISVVFFGTPQFAVPILNAVISSGIKVKAVVTRPDKPVGRKQCITPPPVKLLAVANNIEVLQPEKLKENSEIIKKLKSYQADIFVVVAYGKIIPKEILDIPFQGTINVHPSLLPELRGPSPIQSAILEGKKETGTSIMLLDEEMDHGPILAQEKIAIAETEMFDLLHDRIAELSGPLLVKTIEEYINQEIEPKAQEHDKATYCEIIKKEQGLLDWNSPATENFNKVRALNPWPGTWTKWQGKKVFIREAGITQAISKNPGTVSYDNNHLFITCTEGALEIIKIQLEGKAPQSPQEFINGHKDFIGATL